MKRIQLLLIVLSIIVAFMISGCASSGDTMEKKETPPAEPSQTPPQQKISEPTAQPQSPVPSKTDTVHVVNVQTSPKPAYEPAPAEIPPAAGNFAIQIGAYKLQESADRAAALAKERFGKSTATITDKATNLLKVLVGNFVSKDEARNFRDELIQKFPGEYQDAWVTEIPQK